MYIVYGHVTNDRLNTLLKWDACYKLWLSGPIGTTLEPCQMSHEIIGVATSRQMRVVIGEGKTIYRT